MTATLPGPSHRRVCRVLKVSRAPAKPTQVEPTSRCKWPANALLAERIRALIQRFPIFGYRRLWAWLRFREGWKMNKKTVYRLLKVQLRIPRPFGHPFHRHPATDSTRIRPRVPWPFGRAVGAKRRRGGHCYSAVAAAVNFVARRLRIDSPLRGIR